VGGLQLEQQFEAGRGLAANLRVRPQKPVTFEPLDLALLHF
jgi:hypothetical protein